MPNLTPSLPSDLPGLPIVQTKWCKWQGEPPMAHAGQPPGKESKEERGGEWIRRAGEDSWCTCICLSHLICIRTIITHILWMRKLRSRDSKYPAQGQMVIQWRSHIASSSVQSLCSKSLLNKQWYHWEKVFINITILPNLDQACTDTVAKEMLATEQNS